MSQQIKINPHIIELADEYYNNAIREFKDEASISRINASIANELKQMDRDEVWAFLSAVSGIIKAKIIIAETPKMLEQLEKDYNLRNTKSESSNS